MKKQFLSLSLLLLGLSPFAKGQSEAEIVEWEFPRKVRFELTTGFAKSINMNSIQVTKYFGFDHHKIFSFGFGGRLFNLNYQNIDFQSAGENRSGLSQVRASGNLAGLNLMISTEVSWKSKFSIGGNLDLIGISLGSISPDPHSFAGTGSNGSSSENRSKSLGGDVSDFNLILGKGKDIGTLNSEIYATCRLRKNLWIKAGISHVFTDLNLSQVQDQFGIYSNLAILGIRVRF